MSKTALLVFLAIVAAIVISGCKTVHMIPTPQGWVEEESEDGGNKLEYKPAEKVEIEYK